MFNVSKHCRTYSTILPQKLSYWHENSPDPLRALTVGLLLEQSAKKYPDREAIISCHQNTSITFGQVLEKADQIAAGFHKIGLKKSDVVGIWAPSIWEWYLTKMASARAGLIMAALNPWYQPPEIKYCINKVGIKGIIIGDQVKDQNFHHHLVTIAPELLKSEPGKLKSEELPSLETVIAISDTPKSGSFTLNDVLKLGQDGVKSIKRNQNCIQPDSAFNIQFTSGTTGQPKAAVTSHFNTVNNGYFIGRRQELWTKHHKICMQVPFFHAFGLTISQIAALNFGSTLILPSVSYNPDKCLEAIEKHKCTIIHGTPTMYVDLVHCQEKQQKDIAPEIALSGGAICTPHLFKSMLKHLKLKKVKSVYGLSETTASVFFPMIDESEDLATSTVGRVLDHCEAKVVDENGDMVPFGTPGELLVRSYSNMLGYWNDEEKTKEMVGVGGWLKTGDQFVLYENGYGKIVGRLKEVIIKGGENIFPREVEDFLNTHPKVLDTQVIGVPNERLGEEVCAFIRTKPDVTLTLDEINNFCAGHLAKFKVPTHLLIVDDFPKTTSGKVQKFKLLDKFKNLNKET